TKSVGPTVAALAAATWSPAPNDEGSATAFWLDWARQSFGSAIADDVATIFARIDGTLPLIVPLETVSDVDSAYAFVDELAGLRPRVAGASNLERFDDWLHGLAHQRATFRMGVISARYDSALREVLDTSDPATRRQAAADILLPLRVELVAAIEDAMRHLLAAASTPGELGMIATWENRALTDLLDRTGPQLAGLLGTDLPPEAKPSSEYSGPPRVIVPTVRGAAFERESLEVRVLVLAESPPESGTVYWRRLGGPLHS